MQLSVGIAVSRDCSAKCSCGPRKVHFFPFAHSCFGLIQRHVTDYEERKLRGWEIKALASEILLRGGAAGGITCVRLGNFQGRSFSQT